MFVEMRVSNSAAVLFSTTLFSPVAVTASFPVLSLASILLSVTLLSLPIIFTPVAVDFGEYTKIVLLVIFEFVTFPPKVIPTRSDSPITVILLFSISIG